MQGGTRSVITRYGAAIVAILCATVLRFWLDPVLEGAGVALFIVALVIASWYGGVGPFMLSFALCLVIFRIFFHRPEGAPPDHPARVLIGLGAFFFVGIATAILSESLRAARRKAQLQAEEAARRKDEFLALLAHELRNPLAPIGNALQILEIADDDKEMRDRARRMMERQFQHLVRLVDDLLDVSRIARGKIELRPERTSLDAILERAIEAARPLIDSRQHTLSLELPEEPVELYADPVRLAQVITNLLTNAAKYMDEGGTITLAACSDGDELVLSVRDTGIGIPPAMLSKVFDMFMQVEQGRTREQGGLGIGLTLVKSMVQMHGGHVEACSEGAGKGSEFIIRLPRVRTALESHVAIKGPALAEHPPRNILVVDDNVDAASTLAALLRSKKHHVRTAYGGPAALELVEQNQPEVVILDLGMPGMDGFQVAEQIRNREGKESVLLVAVTGWGAAEDRERTAAAGFDYHFVKPARLDDLENAISQGRRRELVEAGA